MKEKTLRESKDKLENQMFESVMDFELETGLTVEAVMFEHNSSSSRTETKKGVWIDGLSKIKARIVLAENTV